MPSRAPKIVLVGNIQNELHKCSMCHKVFITKSYLLKHVERRHSISSYPNQSSNGSCKAPGNHEKNYVIPLNVVEDNIAKTNTKETEQNCEVDFEMAWKKERDNWILKLENKVKGFGIKSNSITDSALHSILTTMKLQMDYLHRDDDEVSKAWRREVRERLAQSVDAQVADFLSTN